MHRPSHKNVIVGAGLAGLACAARLVAEDREVLVLEAGESPGGRIRTDDCGGFRLDRGFQVLLDAYPECRRTLDYEALRLGRFEPGALVFRGGRLVPMMDPLRRPFSAGQALSASVGSLADKLRIGILKTRLRATSPGEIYRRNDLSTAEWLDRMGLGESMREGFIRPFFSGIFLETGLTTSRRMFDFVFKMFGEGNAALPEGGMQAVPEQLARRLPEGALRFGSRVRSVASGGVTLDSGERIPARNVILATDMDEAARLGSGVGRRPWHGTRCLYFETGESPLGKPLIVLNAAPEGSVSNISIPSDVAGGYAPPGRSLLCVSLRPGRPADPEGVAGEVRMILGREDLELGFLRGYVIPRALPRQDPGDNPWDTASARLGTGLWICGDHRFSSSIEGAMRSGRKTAEAVLAAD